MKRKSLLSILITICTVALVFALATACGVETKLDSLKNGYGIVVEGGSFPEGATLIAVPVDETSEEGKAALEAIKDEAYDKDGKVYVFELSVEADGVKVQPNGKVKVTIPVSDDLTGYDVLHIKGNGTIERLSVAYKNGTVIFETDGFSKFVFVKKTASGGGNGEQGGGSGGAGETTKYTFYSCADTIVPASKSGGAVRDAEGEYITYREIELAEGTEYTVYSHCYPDYYFLGWYDARESENGRDATEKTLLSTETTYTFTVAENIKILALYVYKNSPVKFTLEADGSRGFSYKDGKPTLTLVSSSEEGEKPYHKNVIVRALLGNGTLEYYGTYSSYPQFEMKIADSNNDSVDELDYSTVGRYTITYYNKQNPNINATLEVEVVDSAHTLQVSTADKNLQFRYNVSGTQTSLKKILPTGRLVTLTAETKENYAFTGWYDENDRLVSEAIVYCFEMPDGDVTLHGGYKYATKCLEISKPYSAGELLDGFGNEYIGSGKIYFTDSLNINLTVRENANYAFLGWYDKENNLLTEDKELNLTLTESKQVEPTFREKLKYIEIDSGTLSDEGFADGKIACAIGDAAIDYKNFTVKAAGLAGSYGTLASSNYTIDDGAVNFGVAGTYTVTYAYKYDASIKTQIQIVVIDPESARFEFTEGYSYLDHEYDGKATFIALQDVTVNGIPLYNFKSDSKIWDKISYRWIDKETNTEVGTKDVDITINGTVVKNFGAENYKRNIGNEFCGPIKAGAYRFELVYNGKTVLTQESTITTQVYKKITSAGELTTNEGSAWVNFELYYYTIIGYADGKYYAMQMPSIGSENVEVEAREISVDENGNATVGDGNDFAFVYVRYFANDSAKRMEILTGYYGSYVVRSSDSTVDGTLFGSPYIYRTGHTYISDGKVCREYGNKENYGMSVTFDENGAATICSDGGSENGRLRLVKDGDKYVFTSVSAETDDRESFDIFIYRTIIDTSVSESDK